MHAHYNILDHSQSKFTLLLFTSIENFIVLQEFFLKKLSKGKNISKVGQAQIKILLILVYYIIIGVVGMVAFTYNEVTSDTDVELRLRAEVLSNISLAVLAMLGLLPVFLFLILVDTAALKKKFSRKNSAKK